MYLHFYMYRVWHGPLRMVCLVTPAEEVTVSTTLRIICRADFYCVIITLMVFILCSVLSAFLGSDSSSK